MGRRGGGLRETSVVHGCQSFYLYMVQIQFESGHTALWLILVR